MILATTFFPSISGRYRAQFVEFGNATCLISHNKNMLARFDDRVSSLAKEIEEKQKQITMLKNHMITLQTLEGHQLALELGTDTVQNNA